jgi:hypothetical protein
MGSSKTSHHTLLESPPLGPRLQANPDVVGMQAKLIRPGSDPLISPVPDYFNCHPAGSNPVIDFENAKERARALCDSQTFMN